MTLPLLEASSRCKLRERSEEHTSELQSQSNIVCRLLLAKKIEASRDYGALCHGRRLDTSSPGPSSRPSSCTSSSRPRAPRRPASARRQLKGLPTLASSCC